MSLASQTQAGRLRQFFTEMKYVPVGKTILVCAHRNKWSAWVRRYQRWNCALQPQRQENLPTISVSHPDARVVNLFAPSLDWKCQLFQRQQRAQMLIKQDVLIFYTQIAAPESDTPFLPIRERLYVTAIPLEHFFVYTLTWNRKYLLRLPLVFIHYDILDNLAAFEGDIVQLCDDHRKLTQAADLVTVMVRQKYEQIQATRPGALLIPKGIDFKYLSSGQAPRRPMICCWYAVKSKPSAGFLAPLPTGSTTHC